MIKQLSFLCVLWVAPLALGQEVSPPKAVAPKADDSKTTTDGAPTAATPGVPGPPLFTEAFATTAPEKSSPFSQFPTGFSMKFDMSGSFNMSFNMKVDKDKAKEKTHNKAKTKKKATEKAKSKPKTEKTE